jgi:hypothetical protein
LIAISFKNKELEEVTSMPTNTITPSRKDIKDDNLFVYETKVNSADECSSFEEYDPENSVCYFECADENECADIEQEINNELDSWTDTLGQDTDGSHKDTDDEDIKIVATYIVSKSENITFMSGVDKKEYRSIWDEIALLSPDSISDNYIETYQIFNNKKNDSLAFVHDDDGNGKWNIAINVGGRNEFTSKEQKTTLIHELGHIISLNSSQVVPAKTCANLSLDEGCANTESYINIFWSRFWKGNKKTAYTENNFVTEYAATDETEDFAESFAFFVLGKEQPTGKTIKDQKVSMIYQFPELIQIRNQMRSTLSQEIIRARKIR